MPWPQKTQVYIGRGRIVQSPQQSVDSEVGEKQSHWGSDVTPPLLQLFLPESLLADMDRVKKQGTFSSSVFSLSLQIQLY